MAIGGGIGSTAVGGQFFATAIDFDVAAAIRAAEEVVERFFDAGDTGGGSGIVAGFGGGGFCESSDDLVEGSGERVMAFVVVADDDGSDAVAQVVVAAEVGGFEGIAEVAADLVIEFGFDHEFAGGALPESFEDGVADFPRRPAEDGSDHGCGSIQVTELQ